MIEFTLIGKPLAKKRPRFVRRGSFVQTYDDMEKEKKAVQSEISRLFSGNMMTGAIRIEFEFYFKRPKSHYGTGKNADILKKSAKQHHIGKPDIDNLVKFYMDCMNKIVWNDDSQVIESKEKKQWHDTNMVKIRIYKELHND